MKIKSKFLLIAYRIDRVISHGYNGHMVSNQATINPKRNLIMEQQIDITLPLIDQFEQFFTMWQSEGYFDIPLDDVKECNE